MYMSLDLSVKKIIKCKYNMALTNNTVFKHNNMGYMFCKARGIKKILKFRVSLIHLYEIGNDASSAARPHLLYISRALDHRHTDSPA